MEAGERCKLPQRSQGRSPGLTFCHNASSENASSAMFGSVIVIVLSWSCDCVIGENSHLYFVYYAVCLWLRVSGSARTSRQPSHHQGHQKRSSEGPKNESRVGL